MMEENSQVPLGASHTGDDVEAQRQPDKSTSETLDWDEPDDPDNPMNWSSAKKTSHIALIALVQLVS